MAKKGKAKSTDKKARVAQKQEKKAGQKEKKVKRRKAADKGGGAGDGGDGDDDDDEGEVDLDAILAEYAREQERFLKVTESVCSAPPSGRAASSLLASPSNANELLLFGGESMERNGLAKFRNELFVYNVARDEWRLVTSPNSPLPRSAHAWCRAGNARAAVYLFGGEFSSPKQGTFYHYSDFWLLDPVAREWSRIEPRKGKSAAAAAAWPPARSGHRMTYFKNYIILFGGFQDTSQQTKYLQDLWIYDCSSFSWHSPVLPPTSAKPDARSSFSFLPHESGAVLYGGYSRVKSSVKTKPGKQGKAGGGGGGGTGSSSSRVIMKPMIHQDTWYLRITPPLTAAAGAEKASDAPQLPRVHWERRKRPANSPNPPRAGATMAFHKGRGIQFGGVHDIEESEEGIESEFFNSLFAWNIDRNRFFPLALRRPRAQPQRVMNQLDAAGRSKRGRGKAGEEEILRNLAALELRSTGDGAAGMDIVGVDVDKALLESRHVEDDDERPPEKPRAFEMPHPRFNAQMAVQGDVLYLFGGKFEKGDREYTFEDLYAIDLGKLDGVKELYRREVEAWIDEESDDDDDDDDDDDNDDDDDEEADDDDGDDDDYDKDEADDENEVDITTTKPTTDKKPPHARTPSIASPDPEPTDDNSAAADTSPQLPHPRAFESLRDFFTRTAAEWQAFLLRGDDGHHQPVAAASSSAAATAAEPASLPLASTGSTDLSVKELRKLAFDRAEGRWWDCREEVQALEDEQEEAGIGEVVSLAAGGAGGGGGSAEGGGRRR